MNALPIIMLAAAIALGIFGAFADGWFSEFLTQQPPYLESVMRLFAALAGNAGGFWACCSILVSYIVVRKTQVSWHGIIAATGFLAFAICSYYATIQLAGLRPGAELVATATRWLLIGAVIGAVSGLGGAWLANKGKMWQQIAGVVLLFSYVGLDIVLIAKNAELNAALLTVALLYAMLACLTAWWVVRAIKPLLLALCGSTMIGVVLLFSLPLIDSVFIRIQHGEVDQTDPIITQ